MFVTVDKKTVKHLLSPLFKVILEICITYYNFFIICDCDIIKYFVSQWSKLDILVMCQ